MMLAIAAGSFNEPSETFIRTHVRTVAPGQTILLCYDGAGADVFGAPILADMDPWHLPRTLPERIVNGVHLRWRKYVDPGILGKNRRRVVTFLRAHGATAMLAEFGFVGSALRGACRDAGVPLFVHFHGFDVPLSLRDSVRRRHLRMLIRSAAGIIAPSQFLAEKLAAAGCPHDKLHIVPCGIDPSHFRPTSRIPGRVAAVCRLVEKKAPHLTIAAFARVLPRVPNARLDMIGDGPLRECCEAVVADLGLGDHVTLHGVQDSDRVAALLQEASMFVQHSVIAKDGDAESFGVSLVEAMASAVPVVTTRHGGFVETVEDGITGLLVPEGDVDGMADAMVKLLTDSAYAAAMGESGRARVLERFTIGHTRDKLRAIMGLPELASVETAIV